LSSPVWNGLVFENKEWVTNIRRRLIMESKHEIEIKQGERFLFGENWLNFLKNIDDRRIELAEASICELLGLDDLRGKRFLDIGSGSGLFSLAARRLGASVISIDYDPASVACTTELKRRYFPEDSQWKIAEGSVLDGPFIESQGKQDVVYSWGVLHHTGDMLQAFENVSSLVCEGGFMFLAIYNDQGRSSVIWLKVKQLYNRLPRPLRWIVVVPAMIRLWGPTTIKDLLRGRPGYTWRNYSKEFTRGMSPWRDVLDWVGGLPFEVATPELVFEFFRDRGFVLKVLRTCKGGIGCNEFVLKKEVAG
jgi:2-polyprenyl-3-methyl-5-hydroxy-6-metoxy-1,4-benzoquinol methylase